MSETVDNGPMVCGKCGREFEKRLIAVTNGMPTWRTQDPFIVTGLNRFEHVQCPDEKTLDTVTT